MRLAISSVLALLIGAGAAHAFPTDEVPTSEPDYITKVKTAAPEEIVSKASIVMMQDGKPRALQAGSNGFTCLVAPDGTPLCADANGLKWLQAVVAKEEPAEATGFIYMLAGDTGTNNANPHERAGHQHWVQTGPHVMIVGPAVKQMAGYARSADAGDPSQPFVMFPGTPWEHLMLPTQ